MSGILIKIIEWLARLPGMQMILSSITSSGIFKVKTSLGALSKNFVGIELDWGVTLGSVTLVRVKSALITAIWIGDRYMR